MNRQLWWELAKRGFRQQATYRTATFAGMFTNTVFAFVRGAILVAAVNASHSGNIDGYDTAAALTYTWMSQALIGPTAIFRWSDIAERVQTGAIATDLARPADFQSWWLATDYGRAACSVVYRSIAQFAIGALLFTLIVPTSPLQWIAFALSAVLAVTVSFGLRFIANIAVFWTVDGRGLLAIHTLLMVALSGFVIPIGFFPEPIAKAMALLPWAGIVQAPIDVFLGRGNAAWLLALQLLWSVALLVLGRFLLRTAHRRLVVQGG